mmetsp:Transcript_57720/g.148481  ORF Transcript_57720/g.148481 Transcript_57720/m.148481 type:complete len:206 (+) Transcript_57720:241-858(+)
MILCALAEGNLSPEPWSNISNCMSSSLATLGEDLLDSPVEELVDRATPRLAHGFLGRVGLVLLGCPRKVSLEHRRSRHPDVVEGWQHGRARLVWDPLVLPILACLSHSLLVDGEHSCAGRAHVVHAHRGRLVVIVNREHCRARAAHLLHRLVRGDARGLLEGGLDLGLLGCLGCELHRESRGSAGREGPEGSGASGRGKGSVWQA